MPLEDKAIEEIVRGVSDVLKTGRSQEGKVLPFTPIYAITHELKERIAVHSELDKFPEKLFSEKAPNEMPTEFEYRKKIYKNVTFPYWMRAQGQLNVIWNDKNYSIRFSETPAIFAENTFEQYFNEDYPIYRSLQAYFASIITNFKLKDPNAVLCHLPRTNMVDQNVLIEPVAKLYNCNKVVAWKEDEYCMVLTDEKSLVKVGNTKKKEGLVYNLYDRDAIWRVVQVGDRREYKFEIELYYEHGLEYLPCQKLKGHPVEFENDIYYESYFIPAVPRLDIAVCDGSTLQMSKYAHAFLQRWEYTDDCNAQGCHDGYLFDDHGLPTKQQCAVCNGTGRKNFISPLSVFEVKAPSMVNETSKMTIPPAGYVPLDHAILDFLDKQVEKNIVEGFSMVNMDVTNSVVKGSDKITASQVSIDQQNKHTFILNISNELFDLYEFSINTIGRMRWNADWVPVVINRPQNFSLRTESDLTEEVAMAAEKGMPDISRRVLLTEYANTRFSSQENIVRYIDLVLACDRFNLMTNTEIIANIASGLAQKWEAYMHTAVYSIVNDLYAENNELFTLEMQQQRELVYERAKKQYSALFPDNSIGKQIIEGLSGGSTASDKQLEAQANLKGTVGGVQGILEIQSSVSKGITDLEAGITMLVEIYGFTEEVARRIIGSPKPLDVIAGDPNVSVSTSV